MALIVSFEGKDYRFGFTRQTAANLESEGFAASQITDKSNVMIPMLVYHAATAYNPHIKRNLVEKIFEEQKDKEGFVLALMDEYAIPTNSLFESNEQGKATWKRE